MFAVKLASWVVSQGLSLAALTSLWMVEAPLQVLMFAFAMWLLLKLFDASK